MKIGDKVWHTNSGFGEGRIVDAGATAKPWWWVQFSYYLNPVLCAETSLRLVEEAPKVNKREELEKAVLLAAQKYAKYIRSRHGHFVNAEGKALESTLQALDDFRAQEAATQKRTEDLKELTARIVSTVGSYGETAEFILKVCPDFLQRLEKLEDES